MMTSSSITGFKFFHQPRFLTAKCSTLAGQKAYDKMVVSHLAEKENNLELVKKESAFAEKLRTKISELNIQNAQLNTVSEAIKSFNNIKRDGEHFILLNKNLPFFAVEALRRGFISSAQAATTLNFWGILQQHGEKNIEIVEMFEGKNVNPFAEQLIRQTLQVEAPTGEKKNKFLLEKSAWEHFIQQTREQPVSEHRFFLVPEVPYSRLTISQAINRDAQFNVLGQLTVNKKSMRIVSSVGIMQAFLKAQYEEPVKITPIIYDPTFTQIRGATLAHECNMRVPFPAIDRACSRWQKFLKGDSAIEPYSNRHPQELDGLLSPWYDSAYNDFFRASVASAMGRQGRTEKALQEWYTSIYYNSVRDRIASAVEHQAITGRTDVWAELSQELAGLSPYRLL
jgi:hypothetical protein